ncbi:uncharacterized protein LOC128677109 isoform X2 [Plodia interpunctella]|uniref:uncharacterized protein LOC128677109 isoform X2 n=1 Tax=Plodia interpunctella TaxID=58824 RepID=UPI00236790A7|nr:uncharacterized protein LOC128677109 isoform X2 [Plodia interpunctella]
MTNNRIPLLEEYRLIERREHEINGAWKGAHILLFFLAFIFGCFCTFCFHMLMYMFDEKCVLFPKLQSLTSLRHNVIYEFVPVGANASDMPVDFLSTQWVEKSACYLPTYVPLVSGIFGLVWTTMFLMCSTGSRTLSGLQRPWRILPPVFVFSLAMGGVCIYSSSLTHNGLEELCLKLSEITGSPTCWLLSAILALVRVIMVVDFQLVRVNVDLIGDADKMLEQKETHVRTVSPDRWIYTSDISLTSLVSTATNKVQFKDTDMATDKRDADATNLMFMLYYDEKGSVNQATSDVSLVPEEKFRLEKQRVLLSVKKEHYFIVKMVFDLVENISLPRSSTPSSATESPPSLILEVVRQYGHSKIESLSNHNFVKKMSEYSEDKIESSNENTSESGNIPQYEGTKCSTSNVNITESMRGKLSRKYKNQNLGAGTSQYRKKSNLKHVSIQTEQRRKKLVEKKSTTQKVQITEPKDGASDADSSSDNSDEKANKKSQTRKKEKQD